MSLGVIAEILRKRVYFTLFAVSSFCLVLLYMFLLPSLPFGTLFPQAIVFITPVQAIFAFVFGVLLALLLTLNVYAYKIGAKLSGLAPAGSVVASLVNALCCTPVIPLLFAIIGGSSPLLYSASPKVEFFFEKYYVVFYAFSSILLIYALFRVMKSISCCAVKRS
jgi:hypothetical protein